MKNNPIKLTEYQNKELQAIADALNTQYQIEKIICFAALSSYSSHETVFCPAQTNSTNDYYLLVLTTEITRIEHVMQDYISKLFPGVFVIAHGLETVMNLVYNYDTFFLNACLNGVLIYTSDGFTMIPDYEESKAKEAVLKDNEAFERIYKLASGFLESAFICLENNFDNNVIFLLHQAVEQGCRALIRLFTGYRSDIHNISRLIDFSRSFSPEPSALFRRHFSKEKHLFRVLSTSYSDARYKDNYHVIDHEADLLCTQVKAFLDLVAELAKKETAQGTARTTVEVRAEVVDYSPALPASL
ncbi:HEPN domain-containing protein [Mucilaginibacter sp. SG538B]|uniref:HEPN domain-containing protein n=1 Tax=Mucilaginibacter sp. SG538B TaxID=2587021 RepID=UPI00159EB5F5|nr:HEPN domain-containing protein [Mucilaginibacter sp. SG538B]NVM64196.1 HEPN domain-containing protein [Mucilaginibacter sp. SG538B]NVM64235.1 HEPN domain-containing protein [Mucilaginibacter sp. SG538B]